MNTAHEGMIGQMAGSIAAAIATDDATKAVGVCRDLAETTGKIAARAAELSGGESRLRRATLGKRVTVYMPGEMAKALRIRAAAERRSVSDLITAMVAKEMA